MKRTCGVHLVGCGVMVYLQEQVIELRHMILMMTGQGEKEESRGGENDESRGGETEESRGGESKESRGGENEESRGSEKVRRTEVVRTRRAVAM